MKERIILAPGLNGNELLKSLALHGVNNIGLRICGSAELARLVLMRSGISVPETFVSAAEECVMVAEAVAGEPYFGKVSWPDIRNIAAGIRRLRSLVTEEDEEQVLRETLARGIFEEKNLALFHVYQRYVKILAERKMIDGTSLVCRAMHEGRRINADLLILEEYPLSPLEEALVDRISGGSVRKIRLQDLFGCTDKPVKISSFKNCYGAPNEVETILADIYQGKKLDRCTVAVTDRALYGQLFFDYAVLYDLPVSFGCGIPVTGADPARLLSLYRDWIAGGIFDPAALVRMISARFFDRNMLTKQFPEPKEDLPWGRFLELLGDLRLTNDQAINEKRIEDLRKASGEEEQKWIPFLEITGRELALPVEEFLEKYALLRKGGVSYSEHLLAMLDASAVKGLCEQLKISSQARPEQSEEDIIDNALAITVLVQGSEAGKLYVIDVAGAMSAVRENLYIAGLSSSRYPGSPKENYLLLDADLRLFGPGAEEFTADGRILRKRSRLLSLVRLASSLGSKVMVSYAGLNVSELKKDNASSLVFELFREEHGLEATSKDLEARVETVQYFEPAVSASRLVGEAYTRNLNILQGTGPEQAEPAASGDLQRSYSPTALDMFFQCPRRFMLNRVLGIPEPEETDPFEIISAMDIGTMAHSLMEELGGTEKSPEEFRKLAESSFDRYLLTHPPLIAENVPEIREEFLEMMETAYEMDPGREVLLEEEDVECTHESGVKIHGFPDRVEKLEDGTCLIVDFKSGRSVVHKKDDIATCLQVVMYAYLMEQQGYHVSGGEYRYIRLGQTVTCRYDEAMKKELFDRMDLFRKQMLAGDFPSADETAAKDACKYCKYKTYCGRDDQQEEGDPE